MKRTLHILLVFVTYLCQAQTVTYSTNSGPSFKGVNFSPAFAGADWNQVSYNDSAWPPAINGGGLTPGGSCDGPNMCVYCTGDTVIWTSTASSPPDTSCFRKFFNFGRCGRVTAASFSIVADDFFWAYLNGHFLGANNTDDIGINYTLDSVQLGWLHTGDNLIAAEVDHPIPYCAEFSMVGTVTVDTTGCAAILAGIAPIPGDGISVYPNPATNLLTVSVPESNPFYAIVLYDMLGNAVFNQHTSSAHSDIDISMLAKGIYTLRMTDTKGISTDRSITKK